MDQSSQTPSRLSGEKSAYLQAHTDDLVQWRAWGKKAFDRAHEMELPVFLSVGYASCPQCRLTQAESFNDTELAGFFNRHFVRILVDRECRPDIDALFQTWSGAATGAGGWPLNLFLLGDGSPFLGGTYFPRVAADSDAQSFMDLASTGLRIWTLDRQGAIAGGTEALEFLRAMNSPADSAGETPDCDAAIEKIRKMLDEEHGGLGEGPKFPQTPVIDLLLATHESTGDAWRMEAARKWLDSMLSGGIFDSADGGIFRSSDTPDWSSPTADKPLADQGLLLSTLARANSIESAEAYRSAARLTAGMLERRMRRPDGGFFSAVFVDAEKAEGEPVDYQVTENAITAYNAIAARGLIEAGAAFGDAQMVTAGTQTLDWLLSERLKGRKLLRTTGDKSLKDMRFLEDYASTVAACLSAYEHAGRKDMLRTAVKLQREAVALFASPQGFVMSAGDPLMPVAPIEYADSPAPSGASMLAENAVRLARLTGDEGHMATAVSALGQFDRTLALAPHLAAHALYVASLMGQ